MLFYGTVDDVQARTIDLKVLSVINMKNKESRIVITLLVMFILLWFVIPLIKDIRRENRLFSEGIYTIGHVEKFYDDHHASPSVRYKFVYRGISYKDFSSVEFVDKTLIGKRFYVLFLGEHPSTSKILLDKEVPAEIKESPYEGWMELPE